MTTLKELKQTIDDTKSGATLDATRVIIKACAEPFDGMHIEADEATVALVRRAVERHMKRAQKEALK